MNILPCGQLLPERCHGLQIVQNCLHLTTAHTVWLQDVCEGSCGEADPDLAASLSLHCYRHPLQDGDFGDLCAVDDMVEASIEVMRNCYHGFLSFLSHAARENAILFEHGGMEKVECEGLAAQAAVWEKLPGQVFLVLPVLWGWFIKFLQLVL